MPNGDEEGLPPAEEFFGLSPVEGEEAPSPTRQATAGRDVPELGEEPSTEEFFGFQEIADAVEPRRGQADRERQRRTLQEAARTEQEREDAGLIDQLFDEAQAEGARLEQKQEEFQEELPDFAEDAAENAKSVISDVKTSVTSGDALKGLARGTIGFATSIGSGLLRAPSAGEVAGIAIEQVPGLEDVGREVREFQDIDALEEAADFLQERSETSQGIIGEPETVTGTAAEIVSRLGLELASFGAAGQAVRAGAAGAEASNIGRLANAASKLKNPQTALRRFSQDLLSGNAVDFLIGASGVENASVPFLADIAKKGEVQRGLEEKGVDADQVVETLEWFNESDLRRGFGEALLGTALEGAFELSRAGARGIFGRAADEDAVEVLGRAEAEEATAGTERAAREVDVEARETGEPTRVRERAPIEGEPEDARLPPIEDEAAEIDETPRLTEGAEAEPEEAVEAGARPATEEPEAPRGEPEEQVEESVQTGRTGAEAADEATTTSEREAAPEAAETRPEEPGEATREVQRRAEELGDREVGPPIEVGATGSVRTVTNADGSEVATQYQVVDAAEIRTSHAPLQGFAPRQDYPEIVQERRYHVDDDAQSFVLSNARELDPDQILAGTTRPTDGPPIITDDGVALGGNARSMMLKTAYANHPGRAREYRDQLIERADRFGLGNQRERIRDMERPVLVRQVVDQGVNPADRGQMAELASKFNDVPTRSRDPLGEAQTRARRLLDNGRALDFYAETISPDETLRAYLRRSDGRQFLQRLVDEGTIKPQTATEFRLDDGTISDEGKVALERMMFAAVVDDPEVLARAPKSVLRDLTHAVPPLVRAQAVEGFDIGPQLRETLDFLHEFRDSDFSDLEEFIGQGRLFDQADEQTAELARFLNEENRATIKAGFRKYAEDAQEAANQRETDDLFGREPISQEEAFEKRFVDRTHEPEIPGLRGGADAGEAGFIHPDLASAITRTGTGFVFGSAAGSMFGNTPEQKWRNSLIGGVAGAGFPHVARFAIRRVSPDDWNLSGRLADFASRVVKKGGKTDPDDTWNLREMMREGYRQIWRSRKPIEEVSNASHKRIRGHIPEERDPAVWAQLTSSAGEHADIALRYGPHRPGTSQYKTERGFMQLLEEIGERQDEWRVYGILRRVLEDLEPRGFFEEGEELLEEEALPVPFELDEARALMEEEFGRVVEAGGEVVEEGDRQLAEWFEEYQRIDDGWFEVMEEVGVLRSGGAEELRSRNPNYWPFERDVRPEEARQFGGERAIGEPGPPTRAFKGSEAEILDPIETAVIQHYRYADLIFRQQVYNGLAENAELLRTAVENPEALDIRPVDPPQRRVRLSGDRLRSELPDHVAAAVKDEVYEMWIPREIRADDPIIRTEMPDGTLQHFEVSPELVDALQRMSPQRLRAWARIMEPMARWLRTGVTVMIDFMAANLKRDVKLRAATDPILGADPDASFAENFIQAPRAAAQALSSTTRAFGELMSTQIGLSDPSEMERLWRSAGGPFGFQDIDRDQLAQALRRQRVQGEGPWTLVKHPIDALRALGDRIRGFGIAWENATRFGAFMDHVDQAGGPDVNAVLRGAMEGKDVTVDFSLQGANQFINELRSVSSFWGARMQGEDKLRRMLHPRPEDLPESLRERGFGREPDEFRGAQANPKKTWATALALSTLPALGMYAVNRENPDYWQIPTWEKNFVYFIPLPGLEDVDIPQELVGERGEGTTLTADPEEYLSPIVRSGNTTWLRLPKAHTLDYLFSSVPMRFIEAFDPANPFMDEGIADAIESNAREFGSMIQSFVPIPTAAQPFIENFFNYDFFTNRGVVSEFEEASPGPERLKARGRSSRLARDIADALDAAPGDVTDVSPAEVDNLFMDWFGGSGRLAMQAIDVVGRPDHVGPIPETELTELPILKETLGRFVRQSDRYSARSVTEFYDRWASASQVYRDYRSRLDNADQRLARLRQMGRDVRFNEMPEVAAAQGVVRENLEELLKRDIYQDIKNELTLIEDARNRVQDNPNLSSAQKDRFLKRLRNIAGYITSLASFKPEERQKLLEEQTFERVGGEQIQIQGNALPARYQQWARELRKAEEAVRRVRELQQEQGGRQ